MNAATTLPTEVSELALVASLCQGFTTLDEHRDLESKWFTNPDYRLTLEALREIEGSGVEVDANIVLAYLEQTGRHADKYAVRSLFEDEVSGANSDYHKAVLKRNWLEGQKLVVRAKIERAAKNGTLDGLTELTSELTALEAGTAQASSWQPQTLGDMHQPPPENEVLVEGVSRRGEVGSVVAAPKVAKSWLMAQLAMSVISGQPWLGRQTTRGKVLLIDNELRRNTIIDRYTRSARAMGVKQSDIDESFSFIALRGTEFTLDDVYRHIKQHVTADHVLLILDSKYRFFTDLEENSNTDQTRFHNSLDRWAGEFNVAIELVHHSTKGNQGGRSVTDVGAGGGAQSRAADNHVVIREHSEDDLFVMDAALRTFPKFEAKSIRFDFPLWTVVDDVEPSVKQATTRTDEQNEKRVKDKIGGILEMLRIAPGNTHSENKLSGNHPSSPTYRAAVNTLKDSGEIEWVDEFKEPRSPTNTGGWKLSGRSDAEI